MQQELSRVDSFLQNINRKVRQGPKSDREGSQRKFRVSFAFSLRPFARFAVKKIYGLNIRPHTWSDDVWRTHFYKYLTATRLGLWIQLFTGSEGAQYL